MDFFGQQANSRLRSRLLLLGFLAALAGTGVVIHFGTAIAAVQLGLSETVFDLSGPVAAFIALFWVAILAGCFFRYLDVRGGGAVLARKFGAEPVSESVTHSTTREQDRELLNVVAEVGVAAGTSSPEVFVLRRESSINAFVLGTHEDKRAMVVTQGALDAFDRDELQAVVAHEFGHIAQGDLAVNMRLMIALGGLMALDEIGRMLIGPFTVRALFSKKEEQAAHPGMFVGLVMRLFGSLGVLFGSLLRSAFSRQREFLADATAVQFTRAPLALASALSVVSEAGDDAPLHLPQAPELVHLCFSGGQKTWVHLPVLRSWARWFTRWFATHPPLKSRIEAIDPHFAVKRRKLEKAARAAARVGDLGGMAAVDGRLPVGPGMVMATTAVVASAAMNAIADRPTGNLESISGAQKPVGTARRPLSDRILLLPDKRSCLAVLFAFFVPEDACERRDFLDAVALHFDQDFADAIEEPLKSLSAELESDRTGIVEHATEVLNRTLKVEHRRDVLLKLEQLVRSLGREGLMNYASLQLIRRKLDIDFPVVVSIVDEEGGASSAHTAAQGSKIKTFDAMAHEFALLLSLMVEASGAATQELEAHYERVLACYTPQKIPRRHSGEPNIVEDLESAFQTLYVQSKPIRRAFVEHCAEIVLHDRIVACKERSLMMLFAASLGCEEVLQDNNTVVSRAA